MLKVTSIGSSSSGNSYIIRSDTTVLLLDVGLSGKKIKEGLASCGISPEEVDAILITHEHVDHVQSIKVMARACSRARVIASAGTIGACDRLAQVGEDRLVVTAGGEHHLIGDIEIRVFALSHDAAEPVGYAMGHGDDRLAVVTDTGIVTEEIVTELVQANKLVFESNYEENLLLMGPYPYTVKRRILGDHGHLSNELAGNVLSEVLRKRAAGAEAGTPQVMLAHISTTNNTPSQARYTVEAILKKNGHNEGADYRLTIAAKEGLTEL